MLTDAPVHRRGVCASRVKAVRRWLPASVPAPVTDPWTKTILVRDEVGVIEKYVRSGPNSGVDGPELAREAETVLSE